MCPADTLDNTNEMDLDRSPYGFEKDFTCKTGFSVRNPQVTSFTARCKANGKWKRAWNCESKCKTETI